MFAIDVCSGGDILFDGPSFSPKPNRSVTLTVWIKLTNNSGKQSLFTTVGDKSSSSTHSWRHYILEIKDRRVRWFLRNERKVTIFSVLTKPLVKTGDWMHLAVTYDGVLRMPKVG